MRFLLALLLIISFTSCEVYKNGVMEIKTFSVAYGGQTSYHAEVVLQDEVSAIETEYQLPESNNMYTYTGYYWPNESPASLGYKYKIDDGVTTKFYACDECSGSQPGGSGRWADEATIIDDNPGGTGSNSSKMIGTWARNDGQNSTYVKIEGTVAITCNNGTATTGTFNASAPSMTYFVDGQTYVFPLAMSGDRLIVKVPSQGTVNHIDTEYIRSTTWPCGGSSTSKGTIMVWSNAPSYGFTYNFDVMNVSISSVSGTGTISAGMYTSAPACGSSGCLTKELAPGQYTVTGKIYPLKPISGPTPPTYTTSLTVTVVANQCTKVLLK